ncbi:MAG: D-alanyl-D-alanine carboxypeptidase/D-alanyl-D-alanine-endopeptidase [Bacteroidales bacterium]|nr:D-alanyl-D-alanine carboxypeptidase/D-alanyl-D-alanine-endopeptidase [Bacteroidales bacterium]
MKTKNSCLFVVCFLSLFINNSLFAQATSQALEKFLKREGLQHAAISFEMKNISSGEIISSFNENVSLTPASVNKIVTTATALEKWGDNYKIQTLIYHDGFIQDSLLIGNLFVEGGGDPTLGSEFIDKDKNAFLRECLKSIREKGINRIEGNLIVLDHLFGYDGVSYKWLWEDMGNYYAPVVVGASIFDNMYRVSLRSFRPGESTQILSVTPSMENLIFHNEILSGHTNVDLSAISGMPFSKERRLYGFIPPNRTSFVVKGDIPDPGLYLATYLKSYLESNNISVTGKATTYRLDPVEAKQKNLISAIFSPDMAFITRVVNVRSNNHYAEHIYKLLTLRDSINIKEFWKERGLDSSALFLYDGSGLSPQNAVSAAFINSILEYMYNRYGSAGAFYRSFPVAGKEGTVVSFLKGSILEGKVWVKSGSLTNVCSYSGYIEHGNQKYVFSILVNNFNGSRSQLRKNIGDLLVALL